MSQLHVFLEKTTEAVQIFENLKVSCSNEDFQKKFFDSVDMNSLHELAPKNLIEIIDRMKDSTPANEPTFTDEVKALTVLEKKSLRAMMDLVVKLGILENADDLEKRRHFYELICQICEDCDH